jgi:hypothetical protein
MKANLKNLADEIARVEGGAVKLGTPQIAEVLAVMANRWRGMTTQQVLSEISCIIGRAGTRGRHSKKP